MMELLWTVKKNDGPDEQKDELFVYCLSMTRAGALENYVNYVLRKTDNSKFVTSIIIEEILDGIVVPIRVTVNPM